MPITRQTFVVATDTGGDWTDTGPPCHGAILQMRYVPGTAVLDTGCDIDVSLVQSGVVVASYDNIGSAAKTWVPKQPVHDTGGAAVSGLREFAFSEGDMLRVTFTQSAGVAGSKNGKLYVWVG